VTILPVLFLAWFATIVCRLAVSATPLGPACLAVGAVFVARVDLFVFVHSLFTFDENEVNLNQAVQNKNVRTEDGEVSSQNSHERDHRNHTKGFLLLGSSTKKRTFLNQFCRNLWGVKGASMR